ncbi:thiamine transporter 2-like isoform X2 [Zootermopsis nevadensis]|uniref:thiamine transporter 2-like isoform X2 n=1 Tax=Zootermopsis nevadensis TaxID=136037 RepID=UPI000B8E7292|nr:thiamine transporter 2-like isoform X2 [Zootermopsis nevadensis]
METWLKISLLLCFFGSMKEFRPSEPFVTHYLLGEWKNFTSEQVNQDIFPIGTYAYLAELVIVFLVTDLLRYKPIIVLDGIFGVLTWSLLIWGKDILTMQIMEIFYGFFMAAEVAYYTYIYAQVDREHYQHVTSHTRTAYLFGRALSGVVSQALVSTGTLDYYQLNFISLAAVSIATLWAFFLPSVQHSVYFYRENIITDGIADAENLAAVTEDSVVPLTVPVKNATTFVIETKQPTQDTSEINGRLQDTRRIESRWRKAYYYLWKDFTTSYTNLYVLKWSFWWALATCGFLQSLSYIQLVWQEIIVENHQDSNTDLYNGAVEALYTLVGAATSLGLGWLHFNWHILGEATLAVCSIIEGVLLIMSAMTNSMIVAYILYVLFGVIYHTVITVANAEVAKNISEDSYGLIFGVNTFIALVFQSILTLVVVSDAGMALEIRPQA